MKSKEADTIQVKHQYNKSREKVKQKYNSLLNSIIKEQKIIQRWRNKYILNDFNEDIFKKKFSKLVKLKEKLIDLWKETLNED